MLGIALHPPSLISLMIDRERFAPLMVPAKFGADVQEELEALFARKPRGGVLNLLLVEGVHTIGQIAALFPALKVRIVVLDVVANLKSLTDLIVDVHSSDPERMVSIKATALNHALVKLAPTSLEDHRQDFVPGEEVQIAKRDGRLVTIMQGSSEPFQIAAAKYLLSYGTFAAVKRAGRNDKPRVSKVHTYIDSEEGVALALAYMDMSLFGTNSKVAALFSKADLADLRHIIELLPPNADATFRYEVPERMQLARGV